LGKWSEPPRRCPGLSFCTSPSVRLRSDPLFRQHRRREHGNYGGANPMMQTRRQSRRRMMNRARQQYDRGGLLPTAIHPICIRHPLRLPDAVSTRLRQHQTAGPNRFGQWIKGPHPGEKRWRAGLGLGWAGWGSWPPFTVASTHLICQVSSHAAPCGRISASDLDLGTPPNPANHSQNPWESRLLVFLPNPLEPRSGQRSSMRFRESGGISSRYEVFPLQPPTGMGSIPTSSWFHV
jgi:hypothetical protein